MDLNSNLKEIFTSLISCIEGGGKGDKEGAGWTSFVEKGKKSH